MSTEISSNVNAVIRTEETATLRFERRFPHSVEKVWAAITEPERIREWLAPTEIDLRVGGALRIAFENTDSVIETTISALEPGRVLVYRWRAHDGADLGEVRWELIPEGDSTRLVLTHDYPGPDTAEFLAGWQAHLLQLEAALRGEPIASPGNIGKHNTTPPNPRSIPQNLFQSFPGGTISPRVY